MNGEMRWNRGSLTAGSRVRDQGGFALLVALVAIVGLTALATGGFLLANSERQISESHMEAQSAFYVAETGLQTYLAEYDGGEPQAVVAYGEEELGEGRGAEVTATRLANANNVANPHRVYVLRSTGVVESPRGGESRRSTGAAVMTYRTFHEFEPSSPVAAPPGLDNHGGPAINFDGSDQCGVVGDKPDLVVPEDGYSQSGGQQEPEYEEKSAEEMFEEWGIDWESILDGESVRPDYTVTSQDEWPELEPDEFPIIFVDSEDEFRVPDGFQGQGVLISRNDIRFRGGDDGFLWEGMILAGGTMTADGDTSIYGALIAGLNLMLGEEIEELNVNQGRKDFRYNSCHVAAAMQAMQNASMRMAQMPRSWFETF